MNDVMRNTHPLAYGSGPCNAWVAFEAFRRFGFDSDDIYFAVAPVAGRADNAWGLHTVLKAQGKTFVVVAGIYPTEAEAEKALELFQVFGEMQNMGAFPEATMTHIFHNVLLQWGGGVQFAAKMKARGFVFPCSEVSHG